MRTAPHRATLERREANRAAAPIGHHSRRNAWPIAAESATKPRATVERATEGPRPRDRSRRWSKIVATAVVPRAEQGLPDATRQIDARFQLDTRAGARRRGCRRLSAAADVPYSTRRLAQGRGASRDSWRTMARG
ncbi:MAG: hypothetical protein ACRDZP_05115, partial [Acidimicrobiales bacterium]